MILQEEDYHKVGPGWRPILEALDQLISFVRAGQEYRLEGVLLKEKLGGLDFYFDPTHLSEDERLRIWGARELVRYLSFKMCEKCGSIDDVTTEPMRSRKMSRSLTLCDVHHRERDAQGHIGLGGSVV